MPSCLWGTQLLPAPCKEQCRVQPTKPSLERRHGAADRMQGLYWGLSTRQPCWGVKPCSPRDSSPTSGTQHIYPQHLGLSAEGFILSHTGRIPLPSARSQLNLGAWQGSTKNAASPNQPGMLGCRGGRTTTGTWDLQQVHNAQEASPQGWSCSGLPWGRDYTAPSIGRGTFTTPQYRPQML